VHKIYRLEAEIDASQALVREACFERDELRFMLDSKQAEMHAEDQDFLKEMQTLLTEFAAHIDFENSDVSGKSAIGLLKHFAKVTEKCSEKLAARAEVSKTLLLPFHQARACEELCGSCPLSNDQIAGFNTSCLGLSCRVLLFFNTTLFWYPPVYPMIRVRLSN
jgi:hypothetical protein